MAGHLLFNSGSNESSLAPQFKWLDNTFNFCKQCRNPGVPASVRECEMLSSVYPHKNHPLSPFPRV